MRDWLTRVAAGVAGAAGAAGLGLETAGVRSTVRAALVLLFLIVAPTAAVAGTLRGFDGFARLIIAFTAAIVILALTSVIMLLAGVWSAPGGLLAVAGITAACQAVQAPPVRRAFSGRQSAGRSGAVAAESGRRHPLPPACLPVFCSSPRIKG
jgi:hypothetical protein